MITKIVPKGSKVLVRANLIVSNLMLVNDRSKATDQDRVTHIEIVSVGDQVPADKFNVGDCCLCDLAASVPIKNSEDPLDYSNMKDVMHENRKDVNVTLYSHINSYHLIDFYNIHATYTYVPDTKDDATQCKSGSTLNLV